MRTNSEAKGKHKKKNGEKEKGEQDKKTEAIPVMTVLKTRILQWKIKPASKNTPWSPSVWH